MRFLICSSQFLIRRVAEFLNTNSRLISTFSYFTTEVLFFRVLAGVEIWGLVFSWSYFGLCPVWKRDLPEARLSSNKCSHLQLRG